MVLIRGGAYAEKRRPGRVNSDPVAEFLGQLRLGRDAQRIDGDLGHRLIVQKYAEKPGPGRVFGFEVHDGLEGPFDPDLQVVRMLV